MTIASGVTRMGRGQAEALMESACTVTKVATGSIDPATGLASSTTTTVYTGKCRVRWSSGNAAEVDSAGQILAVQTPTVSLPVEGSGAVLPDMLLTVTANALDTSLVGVVFRVKGIQFQTHGTARRLQVEVES